MKLVDTDLNVACREMPEMKYALSYLQKVKVKFGDRPNVYNQFLEILKEFKAQT